MLAPQSNNILQYIAINLTFTA